MREQCIRGRMAYPGYSEGIALVTPHTFPGYGGIDPATGLVIDRFHELYGENIKDRILVIRGARGSSGWAGTYHMARILGTAPAGIIFTAMTSKICLGVAVMKRPAMTDLETDPFAVISTGDYLRVDADNRCIYIEKRVKTGESDE